MFVRIFSLFLFVNSAYAGENEIALNTGHDIPLIGLGTYLIHGDELTNRVVDEALSAGYRLFDSAHLYNNEDALGKAFKDLLSKHKLTRKDIFITTKFFPSIDSKTESDYEKLVNTSLTNLQTDYIDLFLIHWPGVQGLPRDSQDVLTYRHQAWKALVKFHKAGLIRSIGVSNFMVKHLEDLKTVSDVVPALNQVEWHPNRHNNKLLDYCKENGIVLQAYSSLGSSSNSSLRNDQTVGKIAEKLHKSPSQVLLRWATQKGIAIIPKATSRKHLDENINLNFTIPDEDMAVLDGFEQNPRDEWNPDKII